MNWFDRWFLKQSIKAWENSKSAEYDEYSTSPVDTNKRRGTRANRLSKYNPSAAAPVDDVDVIEDDRSYTIKMQPANGGTILQVAHYDKNSEMWIRETYIVSNDEDLGTEISSILVQYKLKHV